MLTRSRPQAAAAGIGIGVLLFASMASAEAASDWGAVAGPAPAPVQVIGSYDRGCIAGAEQLSMNGPGWQVMRPSRQRFYGHPALVGFIEALGQSMLAQGWPGILIGDMAQARGGPMRTGHRSHQIGLDVDIWFLAAPTSRLSVDDRETLSAVSVVSEGGAGVRPDVWNARHVALLRSAADLPEVDRIFVNPAIKRELCHSVADDRSWLGKIRPWWGHDAHLHVRLACPSGDPTCQPQAPLPVGDGCDAGLEWWFSAEAAQKLRERAKEPPARALTLDDLPAGCRAVFFATEQM